MEELKARKIVDEECFQNRFVKKVINVGTRQSQLAKVQTNYVVQLLRNLNPELDFKIIGMDTVGDNIMSTALSKIGEKSLFTKELEVALQEGVFDFVVHSLKDLPTTLPEGMVIAAVLERENPQDAVVLKKSLCAKSLDELADDSVVGTSSLRRAAQLRRRYPHLRFKDVRGNLNTRLKKLDDPDSEFDALILAAAGLIRLNWHDRMSIVLSPDDCLHAVGQGALAVECRLNDQLTLDLLKPLNHPETMLCCLAERSFLKYLSDTFRAADNTPIEYNIHTCLQLLFKEGGCSVPCAVSTSLKENELKMSGGVYSLDGFQAIEGHVEVPLPTCGLVCVKTDAEIQVDHKSTYVSFHEQTLSPEALSISIGAGLSLGRQLEELGAIPILVEARRQAKQANMINAKITMS